MPIDRTRAVAQRRPIRSLNDLASQFPPATLIIRFTPDDAQPDSFRLVSIQPTAR